MLSSSVDDGIAWSAFLSVPLLNGAALSTLPTTFLVACTRSFPRRPAPTKCQW